MPRKAKQAVQVAPSQRYGQGVQQQRAQQAIPLPNNTPSFTPTSAVLPAQPPQAAQQAQSLAPSPPVTPGMGGALDRPSERSWEHVSTGLPIGGGAGPEALSSQQDDDLLIRLRAMYAVQPNQDIADLIEVMTEDRES